MYERFTDRAEQALRTAQAEAVRFHHEYIGTEHLLLGLLGEGRGVAANVLRNLGVDPAAVRRSVEADMQPGREAGCGRLPRTPGARFALRRAVEEAGGPDHRFVGAEHLLLGLLGDEDGAAGRALQAAGLRPDAVRAEVRGLLGRPAPNDVAPAYVVVAGGLPVPRRPATLSPEQLQLVRDRVRHLAEQKEVFVAACDFTLAARCRDEAEALAELVAWYEYASR